MYRDHNCGELNIENVGFANLINNKISFFD